MGRFSLTVKDEDNGGIGAASVGLMETAAIIFFDDR